MIYIYEYNRVGYSYDTIILQLIPRPKFIIDKYHIHTSNVMSIY